MQARVRRHRNPFRFGALAKDDDFADRHREVKALTGDAMNGQDVVVFAPRRLGKTSLVSAAMTELVRNGVLVADIDLWKIATKEKLAEALAASIYANLARRRDRAIERAMAPFRGLRITPRMTIDPESGGVSFSFTTHSTAEEIDGTLERLLELPAELGAEQGKQVVLVIDEFQEIGRIDTGLTKLMRSVFQQQSEVCHIYLGSKRHLMEAIFNDEQEPFWRSAKQMELGPIPTGEFEAFIKQRFSDTEKTIADDVAHRVLASTGGHPYATQRLCYELWQETDAEAAAGAREFSAAFKSVLESEHSHFTLLWEDVATAQQLLLEALAREPGRPFTQSYLERHQLPSTSTVQRAVEALTRRELISVGDDGLYRITEPFLAEWISEYVLSPSVVAADEGPHRATDPS
ncbi:MAG TPA: ATP-binding protein [Solirubrobacterales bacterium]|jgi:hypothetical protein